MQAADSGFALTMIFPNNMDQVRVVFDADAGVQKRRDEAYRDVVDLDRAKAAGQLREDLTPAALVLLQNGRSRSRHATGTAAPTPGPRPPGPPRQRRNI